MPTYAEWQELRALARSTVEADLRPRLPELRLTPIGFPALEAAKPWRHAKQVGWEWAKVVKRPQANRFELAIWHGATLCGLAYGPAAEDWTAIAFLEGNPGADHPLKGRIATLAVAVLEVQAIAAGAAQTRLLRPLPELREHYGRLGYLPVADRPNLDYLCRTGVGR